MSQTRVERKERTRRAILQAGLNLCEDSSLVALSLRQVTKEVGIVPTAFYRHFDSIEALGLALVEESFVSLRAMLREVRQPPLDEPGRGEPSFLQIVDRSVMVVVAHVNEHRQHFAFIGRERTAGPPAVRAAINHEIELTVRELATDVAGLPGTDALDAEDLRTLAGLIVTAMVAIVEQLLRTAPGSAQEAQVAQTACTQLRMVLIGALNWRSRR